MSKKGLSEYRQKVYKLLEKRAKFVDARSYNFFVNKVFSAQKKKLDEIYTTLKAVKKFPDVVITKKSFNDILQQAEDLNKEYKVTVYANFKYTYPKSKKIYKEPKMSREAVDTFTIKGKSKKAIKKIIENKLDECEDYANDIDSSHKIFKKLESVEFIKSPVPKHSIPLNKIPMKDSYTLHRDWLKYAEGIDTKAYDDMKGQCVYELLSQHLSNPAKRINVTKEKLFDTFNEYYKSQHTISDLDYGVDVFQGNFTMDSGVTTEMIKHLCEQRKISLYAFDAKENCFEKVVHSKSPNYRPIIYYLIDGHMYLVTAKETVKSLTSAEKVNKNVIVSSLLEIDDEPTIDNEVIECKSFADALQLHNGVVILPVQNITDDVHEYIRKTQRVPKLKVEQHHIVRMTLQREDKSCLVVMCDPNILEGYTWKDVKAICDKANIPFKNQRIGGLISALRKKFFKPERRVLTADEKSDLVQEQSNKCMICQQETKEFEFDHIQSLANGGSNELDNFQALCKACHQQKTMEERDNSDFIKFDPIASTFNEKALEIVRSQHFKQWAFIEKLYEGEISMERVHKIDHVKCRRNLVMHSPHDFPMYSVMDYPTAYNGTIQCGYYFVETDNYFPMRGNGWYNYTMVKYCIDQKINMKITHQFIPSFTIKNDYFKGFAEHLLSLADGSSLGKLIINSLVGCWGIQSTKMENIHMTTDKYEASRELCRDGVMVTSNKLDNKTTLFSIIDSLVINKDDMFLPLYNQIVAMEAIELHRLENLIVAQGGVPLERNTDAILYRGNEIDISSYYWDDANVIAKYRYDDPSNLNREAVCRMKRTGSFQPASFEFNTISDNGHALRTTTWGYQVVVNEHRTVNCELETYFGNLFQEPFTFQELANEVLASDKGCLVTGVAGTGKTYFANMLIETLEKAGKRCDVKLAPTNKASSHIKGQTIHKYYLSLFLSNNYEKKLLKSLNNMDYIIVDEISMVKEVFYRFFTLIKRYVPKIKFIIIGDFAQFKPVNDNYKGTYEHSPALHHLCDGQRVTLTKCRRSDSELFNLYTNVHNVDASRFEFKQLTDLNIAYTHNTRKYVNRICMDKFSEGQEYMVAQRSIMNKKTQTTKVFVGLPIVAHRNSKEMEIFNSEVFEISDVDFDAKTFTFINGDTAHTMNINQFSSMFYPAFCITAHVSQGCTFDKPYTIWDWNHPRMDETAKYVALSRATSIKNIQIK